MTHLQLLRITEVADRLSVSRGTVYNLIQSGRLKAVDIGQGRSKTRVSASDLETFVQSSVREGAVA